ncbi:TolB family protein [Bacteroidota bacterium]
MMKLKLIFKYKSLLLFITTLALFLLVFINEYNKRDNKGLNIIYPFNGSLFPPEFPSPTFIWNDMDEYTTSWKISLSTYNNELVISEIVNEQKWQPEKDQWDSLKLLSNNKNISVKLHRYTSEGNKQNKEKTKINIGFSKDSVGAPILYREIPIPFKFAEKHPDSMSYRLCNVGSDIPPHDVMKKFMVCGNCHSFTSDGKTVGLDFDAAHRDKGGYFISDIKDTLIFNPDNYLSWTKLQGKNTFGTFSRLSPDGRYIVTTIKDRVLSRNIEYGTMEEIAYSQLFFPVNGVLAIYDRKTKELNELPGANLGDYVQTSAFWDPNGENLYFARAKALPWEKDSMSLKVEDEQLVEEYYDRKHDFKFNVYTIPFNNGKGGTAKPVKGASHNNMSNYFPTVSPDGKWLIFCQAENYMLLMPDSRLYIVPVEGGNARKLRCNMYEMNSWHSFSPNGKWLVFSSKALSYYTDMFLTHLDEKGRSSIPVVIERARKKGRVANYPEFVNMDPEVVFNMSYEYINISHIKLALLAKDTVEANFLFDKFINQDQYSTASEFMELSNILKKLKRYKESEKFYKLALEALK